MLFHSNSIVNMGKKQKAMAKKSLLGQAQKDKMVTKAHLKLLCV